MSNSDNGSQHDPKRRRLLKAGGALSVGGAAGGSVFLTALFPPAALAQKKKHHRTPPQSGSVKTLAKFVDALPIAPTLAPSGKLNGVPFFQVDMRPLFKKLHRDLPATALWGYNGLYPSPTFEVRTGKPIAVKWTNSLPGTHFLPIDDTIHGAEAGVPAVRTVVHLHGSKTMPDSDGYPEAWFTNGFAQRGPFFVRQVYEYPNDQQATTLWYHDHALGITRLNVYAGLGGGFYLIRDDHEDSLGLPSGPYEIPLSIQDRFFNRDGSLLYPVADPDPDPRVPPIWIPEFFGDTVLVNGKVWPFLEVEPRKYRFRILDASNARFYHMTLQETDARGEPKDRRGPVFQQIGSDGGLLPAPVLRTELLIAPAERLDVVIDFSGLSGKHFVLTNDARAPFPDGDDVVPTEIMMFKVNRPLRRFDDSKVPGKLNAGFLDPRKDPPVRTRHLVLSEDDAPDTEAPIQANITTIADPEQFKQGVRLHWDDPVTEDPKAGTVEEWRLVNTTGDAHPIHVHLVQFQILDRRPF
ncbi:MAG TPA: multicopper oxidase domain-containing protein, partial [Gemmatimonadales bacterium]|nr:multicopper oxidase domain-containing protein [Gemmatimonadales bacterium]